MRLKGRMLPGSGAGATTGHTGVGFPSSARAPADVAPSATVVGLGRLADGVAAFFGVAAGFPFVEEVVVLGATLDVSCANVLDDADTVISETRSAKARRELKIVVNT